MSDFLSAYKPFRNYLAQLPLIPNLVNIWGYQKHVVEGHRLDPMLGIGRPIFEQVKSYLRPWDIELLVRELLLNANSPAGPSLASWNVLSKAVNYLHKLEDFPFAQGNQHLDVQLHLNRMAHRQLRWQGFALGLGPIVRALKIYGGAELDTITMSRFGMSMLQLVQLSFAVSGNFLNRYNLNIATDYGQVGIPRDAARAYCEFISCDIPKLRAALRERQIYDHNWAYTWNPLESTPLIRVDPEHSNRVICPIPRYVLSRATTGVFYDVANTLGFDNKYGDAFQAHIGELLRLACLAPTFKVESVKPFAATKANLKHGPDWILSDSSAHLVIECKTKRMTLGAKQLTDIDALRKDIVALANAIVQTYKNIRDAHHGEIAWRPEHPRIFPMVVTLEDWHLLSPRITKMIEDNVAEGLLNHGIDVSAIETMPFTIVSANELEIAAQVIAQLGIEQVLAKSASPHPRYWGMHGAIAESFPEQLRKIRPVLFEADAATILSQIPKGP